jgi:hypothetical protein
MHNQTESAELGRPTHLLAADITGRFYITGKVLYSGEGVYSAGEHYMYIAKPLFQYHARYLLYNGGLFFVQTERHKREQLPFSMRPG